MLGGQNTGPLQDALIMIPFPSSELDLSTVTENSRLGDAAIHGVLSHA